MSVHTRKDGQVFVKYYIKSAHGRRKEKREYFGSGFKAEAKAYKRNDELKSGGNIAQYEKQNQSAALPLFKDLVDEYLKSKVNDLPETSIKNLWYKLRSCILPELGHIDASRITNHRLDLYVKKRLKTPVIKRMGRKIVKKTAVKNNDGSIRTISKTTVHRELSDIIAILNWSVARGHIPKNPAAGYKKPKRDDVIIRPPGAGEIKAIIKNAAPHLKRALLINYYTGLRPGNAELYHMKWHDIDWHGNTILVISALKGGPVKRSVAIHPALLKFLKKWFKQDENQPHPYIIHWQGRAVKSIKTSFKTAKKKAGIKRRIRLYDFRHAAITQMILHGDLKAASQIAGHSSVEMTIRQYEHITSQIKRETVEAIEEIDI